MKFCAAGRNMTMAGHKVGPVRFIIGSTEYVENIHVAPIGDNMLIGLDFLVEYGAKLDMEHHLLTIGEDTISLQDVEKGKDLRVSRVSVAERRVIPPQSIARVKCQLDSKMPDYVIEADGVPQALVPRTVHSSEGQPLVCVVNASNNFLAMKKGEFIGNAVEANVLPEPEAINVKPEGSPVDSNGVPEHLKVLLDASKKHLSNDEFRELKKVICSYQEVFAAHVFDIGTFQEIKHKIDTRDARPIKQRMRRTPIQYVGEEKDIKKMLEAGVIQPSVSEWASPPVLVRKRDGSVRFCIDYRALNDVTVKDVYPLH